MHFFTLIQSLRYLAIFQFSRSWMILASSTARRTLACSQFLRLFSLLTFFSAYHFIFFPHNPSYHNAKAIQIELASFSNMLYDVERK